MSEHQVDQDIPKKFLQKIKETYQPFLNDTTKKLAIVHVGTASHTGYFLTLDHAHIEYKQKKAYSLMSLSVDLATGTFTCNLPCEDPFHKVFQILSQAIHDVADHKATLYSTR